ncbi:hypothetical protein V6N12_009109 [Hibiscus sabdariffa]|uniref:EF-hand domain-containing protein n=1 Tax=Hibiscus sabdariffa TaxID=183260 RepID=A0ABR2C4R6_9ROSI
MDSTQITPTHVSDEEAHLLAMELAFASAVHRVLASAVELDLFEIMAKAGRGALLSPKEVASKLPTNNPDAPVMLDRMFRLLASYSVLTCSLLTLPDGRVERLYGLGPVCKFLTKNEDGVSLSSLCVLTQDRVVAESWYFLKDVVLEGGDPFHRIHGKEMFEYHGADPRFNKAFNRGMSDHSTITTKKILETYDGFEGIKTLVDVGGGTGATLHKIVSKYPTIKGINFDMPHVIKDAPSYPGVEHVGGDMFASVPKGDAIFMKWICHNFSDENCLKILKKCHEALPEKGKVIVAESNHSDYPDASTATKYAALFDCFMMRANLGKERTAKEFEALGKGSHGVVHEECYRKSVLLNDPLPNFVVGREMKDAGPGEGLVEAFREVDEDENGFISAAELRRALTDFGAGDVVNDLIRENDFDGDGQMNYEEFAKFMLSL